MVVTTAVDDRGSDHGPCAADPAGHPLQDAGWAHRAVESRENVGRVLLRAAA
jgi:hypothetical protein